jgi:hypothetical protein
MERRSTEKRQTVRRAYRPTEKRKGHGRTENTSETEIN